MSVCMSVSLNVCMSVCMSVSLNVCMSVCMYVCICTSGVLEHKYLASLPRLHKTTVLLLQNLYFSLVHAKQYNSS